MPTKKKAIGMDEAECDRLVEKGVFEKTGEREFSCDSGRYGKVTIRFRPDLPGLPVK